MAYDSKNPVKQSLIFNDRAATGVSNPPTGKVRIIQRDGTLFSQDDAGLEAELGAGSGGGINYFQNGRFETSITDGVTTGGTATTNTAETVAPLFDAQSLNIASGAGVSTNDFAIVDIDAAVIDAGIVTMVTAYLKTDSAVADGDWTVGVYNVTDAAYATEQTDLKVDVINIHRTPFVPLTGKTYVLRAEFTDTTAGRILIVDQLTVSPDSNSSLMAFEQKTNVVDNTVLGLTVSSISSGSILFASGYCISDSDNNYWIHGNFYYDALADADNIHTITYNTFSLAEANTGGSWAFDSAGGVETRGSSPGTTTIQNNFSAAVRFVRGGFSLKIEKPSWFDANLDDNKVNLLTQDVVQANASSRWAVTNSSIGVDAAIDFDTEYADYTNVGIWENTNGSITIPSDGKYDINLSIEASSGLSVGTTFVIRIDGTIRAGIAYTASSDEIKPHGSCILQLSKGDLLTATQNDIFTINTSSTSTFLEIARRQDYGAFEPIGFAKATATQYGLVKLPAQTTWIVLDNTIMTGNAGFINNGSYMRISRDSNDFYSAEVRIRGSKTNDNNNVNLTFVGILFAIDQGISFYNDTGLSITDTTTSIFFSAGTPTTALCSGGGTLLLGGKPNFFDANLDQGS